MSFFSQAGQEATRTCPECGAMMILDQEQQSWKCPECQGQFFKSDAKICCDCGRPMKQIKMDEEYSRWKCPFCWGEYWPYDKTEMPDEDDAIIAHSKPDPDDDPYYREPPHAIKGHGNRNGRKRKKPPRRPKEIATKYVLPL